MAADIFISFASKDVKVALTLCQAIEGRGYKCWISARDILPGENFQVAIVKALRRAKILLLVFTANSNTSEEMTKELALASQQKMMVIPLRVEDVAPSEAFAYEFATRQWIDAFADWEFSIEQLCKRIGHALEGGEEHHDPETVSTVGPGAAKTPEPEPAPTPAPAAAAPPPPKAEPKPEPKPEPVAKKPEPAPKPAPAPKPEPVKAKAPPPKPAAAPNDNETGEEERPAGMRRLAVASVVLALIAGAALTAALLMRPKPHDAELVEAPAIAAQAVALTPDAEAAAAEEVPPEEEVKEEKPAPVVKKRATVVADPGSAGGVDIPY